MRTINNPMLVSFDELPVEKRWAACLDALENKYTLTFKDMCRILKCNRSWASKYLKPHIHYIYVSNGAGKRANYLRAANIILDRKMTETTWYSKTEFVDFIRQHLTDVTRQTINIPIEELIREDKINEFKDKFITYQEMVKMFEKNFDEKEYLKVLEERNKIIRECATERGLKMWLDAPTPYKRTESCAVQCSLDDIDIYQLMAVHDLKDYGDSDEEIYRDLFRRGCYRLVLKIPDENGVISEKIYYLEDNHISEQKKSMEMVLVKYYNYVSE